MKYSLFQTMDYVTKLMLLEFSTGAEITLLVIDDMIKCTDPYQYLSDWATRNNLIFGRDCNLSPGNSGIFKNHRDYQNCANSGFYGIDEPHIEITRNSIVKVGISFKDTMRTTRLIQQQEREFILYCLRYQRFPPYSNFEPQTISIQQFWLELHEMLDEFIKTS